MILRQFKGPKTMDVIRAQCAAQNFVIVDTDAYDSDYVAIRKPSAPLACYFFSEFNGRFFGTNDDGVMFDSGNPLDGQAWFDALLAFFYEPLTGFEKMHLRFIEAIRADDQKANQLQEAAQ